MKMSLNNLQINLETRLMIEKDDIDTGKRILGVGNQFDLTVVEGALANCTKEAIEAVIQEHSIIDPMLIGTMTWAHFLSDFEPPEIDRGWVD